MNLKNYRGFIFDLDRTLLNSAGVWEQIDVKFLAKRGLTVPDDYCAAICAFGLAETAAYTIKRFSLPESPEALIAEWTEMARIAYSREIHIFPHVHELLALLKSQGVKIAAATTNHQELYLPALANNDIAVFFDAISDSAMAGCGKEKPDIYLNAARMLGLEPSQCVVFEDVAAGLKCARGTGFATVAAAMYGEPDEAVKSAADLITEDYGEIIRVLEG